ncbi:hypothetical protein BaRGS_00012838 [Batillaria attramentaria]|uniref:Uncharacterized protein n=1 Tax=Batillaria attramentaria TaxID=370345 RepID=A0ABD0L8Y9_9CAEN
MSPPLIQPHRRKPPTRKILLSQKADVGAITKDLQECVQSFNPNLSAHNALQQISLERVQTESPSGHQQPRSTEAELPRLAIVTPGSTLTLRRRLTDPMIRRKRAHAKTDEERRHRPSQTSAAGDETVNKASQQTIPSRHGG